MCAKPCRIMNVARNSLMVRLPCSTHYSSRKGGAIGGSPTLTWSDTNIQVMERTSKSTQSCIAQTQNNGGQAGRRRLSILSPGLMFYESIGDVEMGGDNGDARLPSCGSIPQRYSFNVLFARFCGELHISD